MADGGGWSSVKFPSNACSGFMVFNTLIRTRIIEVSNIPGRVRFLQTRNMEMMMGLKLGAYGKDEKPPTQGLPNGVYNIYVQRGKMQAHTNISGHAIIRGSSEIGSQLPVPAQKNGGISPFQISNIGALCRSWHMDNDVIAIRQYVTEKIFQLQLDVPGRGVGVQLKWAFVGGGVPNYSLLSVFQLGSFQLQGNKSTKAPCSPLGFSSSDFLALSKQNQASIGNMAANHYNDEEEVRQRL
eukprot:Gb_20414 [translate_table: standard]